MTEQLDSFDPRSTYDQASRDYEDAARDFWQYISIRTVELLDLKPGDRVLDVPCGSGASLVVAAHRVGPSGRVVGVDYAEQMVAVAEEKARSGGLTNAELSVTDMTHLDERQLEPFDAVICSLGLFFVEDMPALARSLFGLVRPGSGRLGVAVFGEHVFDPMRQVFAETVRELAPTVEVLEPWRRTEDLSVLSDIFKTAGIDGVTIETKDDWLTLRSPDDWWRIVMGSGFRRTVAALDEPVACELRRRCDAYIRDHGVGRIINRTHYAVIQGDDD
jgi:ubiquinone/menaquinone biosynthesis C-methylase UbiE